MIEVIIKENEPVLVSIIVNQPVEVVLESE